MVQVVNTLHATVVFYFQNIIKKKEQIYYYLKAICTRSGESGRFAFGLGRHAAHGRIAQRRPYRRLPTGFPIQPIAQSDYDLHQHLPIIYFLKKMEKLT